MVFFCRHVGQVTPKIKIFAYSKKSFLDQSIQKNMYFYFENRSTDREELFSEVQDISLCLHKHDCKSINESYSGTLEMDKAKMYLLIHKLAVLWAFSRFLRIVPFFFLDDMLWLLRLGHSWTRILLMRESIHLPWRGIFIFCGELLRAFAPKSLMLRPARKESFNMTTHFNFVDISIKMAWIDSRMDI